MAYYINMCVAIDNGPTWSSVAVDVSDVTHYLNRENMLP